MAKIDVSIDASGATKGAADLSKTLASVADRIGQITNVSNTYNAVGVQTGAVIRGVTKDGKEFTAMLGLATKAEKDLAAAGVSSNLSLSNMKYAQKTKELSEMTDKSSSLRDALNRLSRSAQYFVTYKAFNFMADGLKEGIAAAREFQVQLSLIRTISQGEGQQSQASFGADVRGVSDRTGVDVNKIGKAFYDTTSNQIAKGKNVAAFVETAAQLARVTGSETTDTVNLLSSRINAFGLNASDADKLAAQFFQTIDEGRVIASEMANTLGRVDVVAASLGVTMEEVNAVIAITTQKGFKTSDAMTLLTNLMVKLEKPTEATKAFFESLGVSTGEAAVKMLTLPGLMHKIVDAVKSGQAPVSAFFDEIRGRKQFGVFEQSIDQIEAFAKKNKDLANVMAQYKEAVKIRGESPADLLNIEMNKISNIFKIDFGQSFVKGAADILTWAGGVDGAKASIERFAPAVRTLAVGLGTYATIMAGVAINNYAGAASFRAAAAAAKLFLIPLAGFAAYKTGNFLFGSGDQRLATVEPKNFIETADAVERIRKEVQMLNDMKKGATFDPFAGFAAQGEKVQETYRGVLSLLAGATKQNNRFLDDAKTKSKEANDTMKVSLSGWVDGMKQKVVEFKKAVTEADAEIEKSAKKTLAFKDSLDQILFNTQLKFANDQLGEQKINLTENQIKKMTVRAAQLFKEATPEAVDEARKMFDEIARLEADNFDRRQEVGKQNLEQSLKDNPMLRDPSGTDIMQVNTEPLQKRLNALLELRNGLEGKYVELTKMRKTMNEDIIKGQVETNRKLEMAVKAYEAIDVFTKEGTIKPEFRDKASGRLDPQKLKDAFAKAEDGIREVAGGTLDERIKLEMQFMDRRRALQTEAAAQERADFLETAKTKILTEEEGQKKRIEDLKRDRDERIKNQTELATALGKKPQELAGFAQQIKDNGGIRATDEFQRLNEAVKGYEDAVRRMNSDKIVKDGVAVLDPVRIQETVDQYKKAMGIILEVREKLGNRGELKLTDPDGRSFGPGDAKEAIQQQADKLAANSFGLLANLTEEKSVRSAFDETVVKPVEKLKALFPELTNSVSGFTTSANESFRNLTNGGVNDLLEKLKEIQRLMPGNPGQKTSMLDVGDSGLAYAATGGTAGFFPGQPRGRDRYPIWAERGEFIVNSKSTAMYKPMLEAINNARSPQYMARGGYVGGDTNVGDINVTVNGGNTPADTARIIGNRLERDIRRGVVRLKRN